MRVLLLSLFLACAAGAAPPVKSVPLEVTGDTVTVVKSFPCKVTAAAGAHIYHWNVPAGVVCEKALNVLTITAAPKGEHRVTVSASTIDFDKRSVSTDEGAVVVVVGEAPAPGPKPPSPPGPDPAPAVKGPLRVLIIYESKDLITMPAEQRDGMINSLKFQRMLDDRTDKKGPDKTGWNIWEKDQKGVEEADKFWQDAFARPRPTVPYVHLFKGEKVVYEGALPKTVKEMTDLINQYAGE